MTNNIQQGNNTPKDETYQVMLPLDVGIKIEASSSVRLLIEITERMDYRKLNAAYDRLPSATEASPKQMFQLVMLGFMEGDYSTRKLEAACRNDIRFMHILHGKPAPDHNRFCKFIKERLPGEVMEHLHYQLVDYLAGVEEIDFTNLFVDGTKIEAQANCYSFVWKKSTNKYEARLEVKLKLLMEQLTLSYGVSLPPGTEPEKALAILRRMAKDIPFVHGRGKRKTALQRDIEMLDA